MELANAGNSEQSTIDNLMKILPEDGLNVGQSDEPEVETKQPETEQKAAEVKEESKETESDEVEIDYDGNKYRVPKELKDAFLRQQDYTKKTTELAEQRKAIPEPQVVEEYKQKLTHYESLLGEQVKADEKIDWAKELETDPIGALQKKFQAEARAAEWKQVSAQREKENTDRMRQTIAHEATQLLAKRPEWKDEAVWKADKEKFNASLIKDGFKPEEIQSVTDHRLLIIADKARKYDELMTQKTEVAKKIEKLPPKVERPGVSPEGQVNKTAFDKLRKTGSLDDAAATLASLMG